MMSHCIVPNWKARHQRQQVDDRGENTSSSLPIKQLQSPLYLSSLVPAMSNCETGEPTWEARGQFLHGQHGNGEMKQTSWRGTAGDTLESVVHQATSSFIDSDKKRCRGDRFLRHSAASVPSSSAGKAALVPDKLMMTIDQDDYRHIPMFKSISLSAAEKGREKSCSRMNMIMPEQILDGSLGSMTATSGAGKNPTRMLLEQNDEAGMKLIGSLPTYPGAKLGSMPEFSGGKSLVVNKRVRSENEKCFPGAGRNSFQVEERASCAGASAANLCKSNTDTTMMTWANSFESAPTLKTARNTCHDSACQDCWDEEFGVKGESSRSQSSARRTRAAVVHNQSERKRRDRINEKMKALQKLVPHASKTDKASMLEEVIEYLKQLQSQVHMLSNARTLLLPQMVMPLGILHQQQLQMCMLGMIRREMFDAHNLSIHAPQSMSLPLPPLAAAQSFVAPPTISGTPLVSSHKTDVNASNIDAFIPNFAMDGEYGFLQQNGGSVSARSNSAIP